MSAEPPACVGGSHFSPGAGGPEGHPGARQRPHHSERSPCVPSARRQLASRSAPAPTGKWARSRAARAKARGTTLPSPPRQGRGTRQAERGRWEMRGWGVVFEGVRTGMRFPCTPWGLCLQPDSALSRLHFVSANRRSLRAITPPCWRGKCKKHCYWVFFFAKPCGEARLPWLPAGWDTRMKGHLGRGRGSELRGCLAL